MHHNQKLLICIPEAKELEMEMAQVGVNEGDTDEPLFTFWVFILEKFILTL